MKICLVTAFPPSRGGLSEYGFHIASELQQNPFLSLSILADRMPAPAPELEGFSVNRCWAFDDSSSPGRLLRAIRECDPDVVWFNLIFTTFGRNPFIAFAGLSVPLLSRMNGYYTHVTLHHLMDTVDLHDAGVRFPRLYRAAGAVATRLLLMANSVSVLMPAYREVLREKYGSWNVHLRRHGILSRRPEYPDFSLRSNPEHRILAFGKWGTYKRLEPMIEAFQQVVKRVPSAVLVVAGGDHPQTPGYVASVAERYRDEPRIRFTGYVPENQIPMLFRSASIAVMPYSSSSGSSGIAHFACAYGVPIVSADIPDFRQMAAEEGLAIDFYRSGDMTDCANHLVELLGSIEQQYAMSHANYSAALRMTMPRVIYDYVRHFDLEQRTKALRPAMRMRRRSRWLRSTSFADRLVGRNRFNWFDRSVFGSLPPNAGGPLSDHDDRRGGSFDRPIRPLDGDGVGAGSDRAGTHGRGLTSAARTQQKHAGEHDAYRDPSPEALIVQPAHEDESRESERNQQGVHRPLSTGRPRFSDNRRNGTHGNGQGGIRGPLSGNNGSGEE